MNNFEIFGTAHDWINIKDFFEKPKMSLVETTDFDGKINLDLFNLFTKDDKTYPEHNQMWKQGMIDEIVFKIITDNKKYFKKFDYVVPSHLSIWNTENKLVVTFDCFKRVKK